MNNKIKIGLIIAALIVIVGVVVWFAIPSPATVPASAPAQTPPEEKEASLPTTTYTEPQLREIVNKIAKERFGEDSFVIFLSTEGPSEVEIDGIKRNVYIYAADSANSQKESGKVRGLYHADADTGEIFDNGSGTMEKVIIGE